MTKNDSETIARILRAHFEKYDKSNFIGATEKKSAIRDVAITFANELRANNQKFNRETFMKTITGSTYG